MKSRWIRALATTAACVSAFALVACGSGNGSTSGAKTYTIAGLLDFSGPFANRGKAGEETAKLWVDYFNNNDGKKDHVQLKFQSYDSGYSPATIAQVYPTIVQDRSTIGILGYGSPTILALQSQLAKNKIPMVQSGTSYSFMNKPGWGFGPLGDPGASWATGITWYRDHVWKGCGKMRVAMVSFDGSSGKDFVNSAGAALNGADDIVLDEYVPTTATDVGINVDRIIASKPDVVIIGTTDALQPLLLNQLKQRNFDMRKVLEAQHESLSQMVALKVPSSTLDGVYEFNTLNYNDTTTQAYQIFSQNASKYGSPPWDGSDQQISSGMIVLTQAIAKAAAKGGALTGQDVYNALNAGTFEPYGLVGTVKFDPSDRRAGATTGSMNQFTGGKIATIATGVPLMQSGSGS